MSLTVAAESGGTELFGTLVSAMQTGLTVGTDAITGTLHYIDEGSLADVWGAGYFMALKFTVPDDNWTIYDSCMVGLDPSVSSGLGDIKNDDTHNGVFKYTGIVRGEQQKFVIEAVSSSGLKATKEYDLRQLVLEPPEA